MGKAHKGVLVTLVDRAKTKIRVLKNRQAQRVSRACIEIRTASALNIIFDNGKEFTQHQAISQAIKADIYFAKPYHSWARSTNENTNGLIRQFLPKSMSFDKVSDKQIKAIKDNLNHRPRKISGYQTPLEVKTRFRCVVFYS